MKSTLRANDSSIGFTSVEYVNAFGQLSLATIPRGYAVVKSGVVCDGDLCLNNIDKVWVAAPAEKIGMKSDLFCAVVRPFKREEK